MRSQRLRKFSFLLVGGLLLAQFGGSACQDQPIQFPDESVMGDEENPAPAETNAENSLGESPQSIPNIEYDDNSRRVMSDEDTDKPGGIEGHRDHIVYDPRFGEVISYEEVKKDSFGITTTTHFEQEFDDFGHSTRISRRIRETGEMIQPDGTTASFDQTTVVEVYDIVYDHETGLSTGYKIKATGPDRSVDNLSTEDSADKIVDSEFNIFPDWGWVWEKVYEELQKRKEAEEKKKKEEEEAEALREEIRALTKVVPEVKKAEEKLKRAKWWLDECEKELKAAEMAAKALEGNEEAQKRAEWHVEYEKNSCEEAERDVKDAQAELDYQVALQKARKDAGLPPR